MSERKAKVSRYKRRYTESFSINKSPIIYKATMGMMFCLYFPLIDRATAPGWYEQFYLNVETLTEMFLIPNNKSFKDAIRSD